MKPTTLSKFASAALFCLPILCIKAQDTTKVKTEKVSKSSKIEKKATIVRPAVKNSSPVKKN